MTIHDVHRPRTVGETQRVATKWGTIAYTDTDPRGEKEKVPVVFIHGNSFSRRIFDKQIRSELADERRLLAVDLLGHGESSNASEPEQAYRQSGYAQTLVEFFDRLGIARVIVVGWSLGGHVGLELVPRFPGLAGLVISGTPPVPKDDVYQGFLPSKGVSVAGSEQITGEQAEQFAAQATTPKGGKEFASDVLRTDGRARRVMFSAFGAGRESDQRAIAESSPVPLAIINGGNDPFVDPHYVAGLHYRNLWHGAPQILPRLGHASFWQDPRDYDALVQEFVDDVE